MRKLNRKQQRKLVWGFEVCLRVLNIIVIGHHTINIPEIFHVFTGFLSFTVMVCLQKSLPNLFWLVLLDEISLISSSQIYGSILCLGKGTKNWLKHRIDLKQQHHRDITPCSFYVSMWTGSLFGERVQKLQEEGRERARACRQTFGTVVPRHPLRIRSWCKLLLARTLTVDRFDLHCFFGRKVACDLI